MLIKKQKAIHQINFTGNQNNPGGETTFFIIEEANERISDFSKETVKVLWLKSGKEWKWSNFESFIKFDQKFL